MGRFATGVTVVTTAAEGRYHGMTANSFTSVSLAPPLVLFCAGHGTRTLEMIRRSGVYAVNVLADHQARVSERFAGFLPEETDRFEGLAFRPGPLTGCPLLEGALVSLECRLVEARPTGDHDVLIAEVVDLDCRDSDRPLLYYSRNYYTLREEGRQERPRLTPERSES
ncbi:MAG: flavin reductase family protein [Candidatus Eremiobacterota bacterium]